MRLYSDGDRVALFMAEYKGKAIAGSIVLRLGRWSWYMYGASSNEQRNLMPNHLLQWAGMQWAKSHGCWYYNFRGIPEVLEEGQELWGVSLLKAFKGLPMTALIQFAHTTYQVTPLSAFQQSIMALLGFPSDLYSNLALQSCELTFKLSEP